MEAEGYNTTKSGPEHSGNLVKSLPAFWHQPLILPTGMAENFTPSTSSGTHPKESQSSDLQPEFLIIRSKISSSGCPLLLAWVQLQGVIPQMLLVYCLGDGSLPRRCFSSSPAMSLLAKERSRAKHSPPFCLEKHPGKRGHMPQFGGFAWRMLGVWLSPSGCLETPWFSFKCCKSFCTLSTVLGAHR